MFDQMPFYQLFRSLVICQKEDQTRGLSENSKRKPFRFFTETQTQKLTQTQKQTQTQTQNDIFEAIYLFI
jgi:hypothetical protein